ncbi:hypothetical protein [Paracoccus siganidrum]|uniref:hypothetical protein n=1 Tax=Paracoccus siganidrum TaxID=1276757 RepID=UPI0011C38054|nr:hypothetical protein [Paracoccus siganidrum]
MMWPQPQGMAKAASPVLPFCERRAALGERLLTDLPLDDRILAESGVASSDRGLPDMPEPGRTAQGKMIPRRSGSGCLLVRDQLPRLILGYIGA